MDKKDLIKTLLTLDGKGYEAKRAALIELVARAFGEQSGPEFRPFFETEDRARAEKFLFGD